MFLAPQRRPTWSGERCLLPVYHVITWAYNRTLKLTSAEEISLRCT